MNRIKRGETLQANNIDTATHRRLRQRITLDKLRLGETGRVIRIDPDSPLIERLGDLGITQGSLMRCERVSLFGDPVAYRVLTAEGSAGTVVALRRRDAAALQVCVERRVRLVARREGSVCR